MSSLPADLREELERRIAEFEKNFEAHVFNRTDAMIPRIKTIDYIVVAITGIVLTIYLLLAIVLG
jgi:hypothetical protein